MTVVGLPAQGTALRTSYRIDAWRSVLQRTNRILTGEPVTVKIVNPVPGGMEKVAGWSDGVEINLNGEMLRASMSGSDPLVGVLRLKGLNYHELCHVLYTPRNQDDLVKRIKERQEQTGDTKWWYSFNALEDQRIETLFASKFRPSRRYFEATILEWVIKHGKPESAILIYGRKYLEPKLRVQAEKVFVAKYGQTLYDEFKTVIDEYITLVLPTNSNRAWTLLKRYRDLLEKMQEKGGSPLPVLVVLDQGMAGGNHGHPDRTTCAVKGRVRVRDVKSDAERAQESIEDAIDADIEAKQAMDAEASQGDDKGAEQGSPGDDGGAAGDQSGSADSSTQSEGGDATDAGGGGGIGDSGTADHTVDQSDLEEKMREWLDSASGDLEDVFDDEDLVRDAESTLDAVNAAEHNGRIEAKGKQAKGGAVDPSDEGMMAVRRVQSILMRIRAEAEPETLRKQYSGRLDPRRVMRAKPHEVDVFRRWDSGSEEETGMEAVMLVDVSGSMSYRMREALETCWVLKRAFDKMGVRCTVMLYDTTHTILYQADEKAGPKVPMLRDGGGTNPTSALIEARSILMKSQAPNKVLVTVTDGGWSSAGECGRIIRGMGRSGVATMLLGLDSAVQSYGTHGHQEAHDLTSLHDLPKAVTKLVSGILRAAMLR